MFPFLEQSTWRMGKVIFMKLKRVLNASFLATTPRDAGINGLMRKLNGEDTKQFQEAFLVQR